MCLNRPAKKNAITRPMYAALSGALESANEDAGVAATVLTGAGGCFTAGNDLGDFLQDPPLDPDAPVLRFLRALANAKKPLIAAVEGLAVGVGTTLLLHCDLVYASEKAHFSLPFVKLGLVPEAGASLLLPRLIGHQRAAEYLLLGEPFGAEAARGMGLVNRVCEAEAALEAALAAATKLASQPLAATIATKALMKRPPESVEARIQAEIEIFQSRLGSPEAREALAAFVERRPPDFSQLR